jgi:hypothetical protein
MNAEQRGLRRRIVSAILGGPKCIGRAGEEVEPP